MATVYHATRTYGHLVRWMAFFDVDEFVRLSPRYTSLHSVLAHVLDAAQALG